ncbi:hypothetical protein [Ornithobacterium rhinotracheale]|uniref:hypothetical protein n=2 Tax=Ornithobacterium rhinotracheale TaxID=28251 RepID=UPI001FF689D4|nr:hypothetical protein [Ornithobacterium rhinotracheale]MCK0201338.1 hypothetical protein [Ornithobacterium rhinotracheale]
MRENYLTGMKKLFAHCVERLTNNDTPTTHKEAFEKMNFIVRVLSKLKVFCEGNFTSAAEEDVLIFWTKSERFEEDKKAINDYLNQIISFKSSYENALNLKNQYQRLILDSKKRLVDEKIPLPASVSDVDNYRYFIGLFSADVRNFNDKMIEMSNEHFLLKKRRLFVRFRHRLQMQFFHTGNDAEKFYKSMIRLEKTKLYRMLEQGEDCALSLYYDYKDLERMKAIYADEFHKIKNELINKTKTQ